MSKTFSRWCTVFEYDAQLRPGVIGVDFQCGDSNQEFVKRYEREDVVAMHRDIAAWVLDGSSNPELDAALGATQ